MKSCKTCVLGIAITRCAALIEECAKVIIYKQQATEIHEQKHKILQFTGNVGTTFVEFKYAAHHAATLCFCLF